MDMGIDWQTALGVVFVSGLLFLLLTLLGFREKIAGAIPDPLRLAVPAGIGLLITFIGLQQMGLIVRGEATFLRLGALNGTVLLSLAGFILVVFLEFMKVRGSLLIGILLIVAAGIILGDIEAPAVWFSSPPSPAPVALELDIGKALSLGLAGAIFSFLYVDLFDSLGTIIGCAYEANMVDQKGRIDKLDRILGSDAIATVFGSLLGTSTITTYVESASGIAAGARTGLASVVTAFLFLVALFFAPLIGIVPGYATAPALVMVGIYMFRNIVNIDFRDLKQGVPAFLTIILMPFTGSISTGLAFGFISYILLMVLAGEYRRVSPVLWVIGVLSGVSLVI